jgi:hypothetical protein
MKDILIVPDVHGRDFWLPAYDFNGEIVFLGDYTDHYDCEYHITEKITYERLLKIVEFKQQNPDRVTLLTGNHELYYYSNVLGNAGRFSWKYKSKYREILEGETTKNLFQVCKQVENYLFVHAGVTKGWYDHHLPELKENGDTLEEQLNNIFITKKQVFMEASTKYRGGIDKFGSPLWADYRELIDEPEHLGPDIFQIIGHTQIMDTNPIIKDNFAMLDNRQLYWLHNNAIEKYPVKRKEIM